MEPKKPCRTSLPLTARTSMALLWISVLLANLLHNTRAWQTEWNPRHNVTIQGNGHDIQWFSGNSSEGGNHFRVLLTDDDSMLVGARNMVYNISLRTLEDQMHLEWKARDVDIEMCLKKEKTESQCQNYLRVLARKNSQEFYFCGTNAYAPMCRTYILKEGKYVMLKQTSGIAVCPHDPDHNSTTVFTKEGKLFSATVADINARDALIYSEGIRTEQYDSKWLHDPSFVSSMEYQDKVYFFFRETAVESTNCGKTVFSRVAQVCKRDQGGGQFLLTNTWTSFLKARLKCAVPGDFSFFFDEIQSTTAIGRGNYMSTYDSNNRTEMVYAVFNTPENSITGSSVCAFRFQDIINSLRGRIKAQSTPKENWLPVPEQSVPRPHPSECRNESHTMSALNFIKAHTLVDEDVLPSGGSPIVIQTKNNYKFTQVAVDWHFLAADQRFYDILFIGTDDGRVIKAINKGHGADIETVIIEDIQVFQNGAPVVNLHLHRNNDIEKLVVVSRDNVTSIPLHRCHEMTTCTKCVALQDPYCSWIEGDCVYRMRGLENRDVQGYQNIMLGTHNKCTDSAEETTTSSVAMCTPCNCQVTLSDPKERLSSPVNSTADLSNVIGIIATNPETTKSVDNQNNFVEEPELASSLGNDFAKFTAHTLAIAVVVSIVISMLLGFLIGFKVHSCRSNDPLPNIFDPKTFQKKLAGCEHREYTHPDNLSHKPNLIHDKNNLYNAPPVKLPNANLHVVDPKQKSLHTLGKNPGKTYV